MTTFTTESGSRYLLDIDAGTIARLNEAPIYDAPTVGPVFTLGFYFDEVPMPQVGKPYVIQVDGGHIRTTPVTAVLA